MNRQIMIGDCFRQTFATFLFLVSTYCKASRTNEVPHAQSRLLSESPMSKLMDWIVIISPFTFRAIYRSRNRYEFILSNYQNHFRGHIGLEHASLNSNFSYTSIESSVGKRGIRKRKIKRRETVNLKPIDLKMKWKKEKKMNENGM